jgi:hypothetical protein
MKNIIPFIFLLLICELSKSQADETDIQNIKTIFKSINAEKSQYDEYELYNLKDDGSPVLVPYGKAKYFDQIDHLESIYIYNNDTLVHFDEYNTTYYLTEGEIRLIESYYSDIPEAIENDFESYYFNEGKLFFYYSRFQKTNYWAGEENCCPSEITEHRYYYKDDLLIRSLEKYLETTNYQDPDAIDREQNYEIDTYDGYVILENAYNFKDAKLLP